MVEVKTPRENREKTQGVPGTAPAHAEREDLAPAKKLGSPFEMMRRFAEEMDRVFEDRAPSLWQGWTWPKMLGLGRELVRRETGLIPADWSPRIEVLEREGKLLVRAELPGLTAKDVDVEVTDEAIQIKGERHEEREEKREGLYYSERSFGRFYRSIPLPEGAKVEHAEARFQDGVLEVEVPTPSLKAENKTPHKIEVKQA